VPRLRARVRDLAAFATVTLAASAWGCSLLSGVDQLQKVNCIDDCDGGTSDGSSGGGSSGGGGKGHEAGSAMETGAGSSAYRAAVLADSPIGYWRLGDGPGSTTCHDESGHGHDGTVSNGVTLGAAGALSNDSDTAAQFDGTGAIDVGGTFAFSGNDVFTWEVWVKASVLDSAYRPFFSSMTFDNNGDPVDGTYMVSYSHQGNTFGFERYKGGAATVALDTASLKVNVWTYIVATSSGIVYVNGSQTISTGGTGNLAPYTADTLFGTLLKGELDEIAIYDHTLSTNAVTNHWNAAMQ
jgi:hypothetical protein